MCVRANADTEIDLTALLRRPRPSGIAWPRPTPKFDPSDQFLEVVRDRLSGVQALVEHVELDAAIADTEELKAGIADWLRLRRGAQ